RPCRFDASRVPSATRSSHDGRFNLAANSSSVRNSRPAYSAGRCNGTSSNAYQIPWRSGSPHAVSIAVGVWRPTSTGIRQIAAEDLDLIEDSAEALVRMIRVQGRAERDNDRLPAMPAFARLAPDRIRLRAPDGRPPRHR